MSDLRPMEAALLSQYFERYVEFGFPAVEDIRIRNRQYSGSLVSIFLQHTGEIHVEDGAMVFGKYSQITANSLPCGAFVELSIKNGKAQALHLLMNGSELWDGDDTGWKIVDAETGEF